MNKNEKINNKPKQSSETLHLAATIKRLNEINRNARLSIEQNNWTVQALKEKLKKSLKEINK